jgi:hypothetical protein
MRRPSDRDDFNDFWVLYLREHREPWVRIFHYAATVIGAGIFTLGIVWGPLWLLLLVVPGGYGIAWIGHRLFQGNNPVVAARPSKVLWGAWCDLRMCWLALLGRLEPELAKAGLTAIEERPDCLAEKNSKSSVCK